MNVGKSGFFVQNLFDPKKEAFSHLKQKIGDMKKNTALFIAASTHNLAVQVRDSTQEVQRDVSDVREWGLLHVL